MCIVQNKIDLIDEAAMTPWAITIGVFLYLKYHGWRSEEVDAVAKKLKLKLFRTSVKENFNVDQGTSLCFEASYNPLHYSLFSLLVFGYLGSKYLDRRAKESRNKKISTVSVGQLHKAVLRALACLYTFWERVVESWTPPPPMYGLAYTLLLNPPTHTHAHRCW